MKGEPPEPQEWHRTHLPGLEVRRSATGLVAMRLLGWEEVLPLSVIRIATADPPPLQRGVAPWRPWSG